MTSTYDINVKIKSLTNFDPGPTTILSISSDALIVPSTTFEVAYTYSCSVSTFILVWLPVGLVTVGAIIG